MIGEIEYEIKPTGKLSLNLKELWEYKELFYFFAWRDIKVKYKQTILGFTWAILQPFIMMVIFTFFFQDALNLPSDGIPYPIFVFSGLLLWNVFSTGLSNASNSMVSNANMIKKIYFPRLIIPMSSILVAVFDFFMAFLIYIGLIIYYQYPVSVFKLAVFLPISLVITVVTTFGLGCLLAALNIKFRDFRYIIPFLIQILLFITPVLYPASMIKYKWANYILAINPLSASIELLRSALNNTALNWDFISIGILSTILLFTIGLFYFRSTEAYFADLS